MNQTTGVRKRTLSVRYRSGFVLFIALKIGDTLLVSANRIYFWATNKIIFMSTREEQISKLTLLLIYLNSWEEKNFDTPVRRAWKGYDFDILNTLEEKGYISQSKTAKSVYLTEEGVTLAKELEKLLEHLK